MQRNSPLSENGDGRDPPRSVAGVGRIILFGFPEGTARFEVWPRSLSWRATRAVGFIGAGLIVSPAVGLIPPHAPWVALVLGIGSWMGIRKWRERFTLLSLRGSCPKCSGSLSLPPKTPLKPFMTLSCEGCNHDSRLTVDFSTLGGAGR